MQRTTLVGCALFVLTAVVTALGVFLLAASGRPQAVPVALAADRTPSAAEFAHDFVDTANAYAAAHGEVKRLIGPHCVQASPGHYMCAYAVTQPGRATDCHLMQARWTPDGPSTITVTLAGRATRCSSLRAAVQSLR